MSIRPHLRPALAGLFVAASLAGCGPLNTPAFTWSKDVEPPPANAPESVRNWLWEQQQPVADGMEISAPATMAGGSVSAPSRWYVCLRQPDSAGTRETVMIIRADRVLETIAGPSPYFCDGQSYAPLARS